MIYGVFCTILYFVNVNVSYQSFNNFADVILFEQNEFKCVAQEFAPVVVEARSVFPNFDLCVAVYGHKNVCEVMKKSVHMPYLSFFK